YDNTHFSTDVDFPSDGVGSGARTFDEWSPGGGILWSPWSAFAAYFNAGTTFQVPTTTQLENPDGPGFNPAIQPERATSFEIGARAGQSAVYEASLAAYVINVEDELIPFESPSGRVAYRNAGSSRRIGLELDGQARLDDWLESAAAT